MRGAGRHLVSVAACVAGALVVWALIARHEQARADAAPPPPPAQVEHRVLVLRYDEYRESPEFQAIAEEEANDLGRAIPRFEELVLSRFGAEGWELVWVDRSHRAEIIYYLKRRAS